MNTRDELLTTAEVTALTGVTFRVLDYWCRTGVIIPTVEAAGSGSRRQFTPELAAQIAVLGRISNALGRSQAGVSTVLLAGVVDALERGYSHLDLGDGIRLSWHPEA